VLLFVRYRYGTGKVAAPTSGGGNNEMIGLRKFNGLRKHEFPRYRLWMKKALGWILEPDISSAKKNGSIRLDSNVETG
jgi:hypothetical protein